MLIPAIEPGPGDDEPLLLFAYGTLGPTDGDTAARDGWSPDAVRGRLFDLGPYPALVDWDDPGAAWVEGHVRSVDRGELERVLDPYEGVEEGLFRRVAVRLRSGPVAWAYIYPHPVPAGAKGPMVRWGGRRNGPMSPD